MIRSNISTLAVLTAFVLMGIATPAQAYIGPGAGLTAIGAFIAFVAAVLVTIIGFIWFPIRRLIRKSRNDARTAVDSINNDDD